VRLLVAGLMLAAGLLMMTSPDRSAAAPSTQPARTGPPDSIAVIGDSISAGTGTSGIPASEQPQNSWSTGTNNNSLYQRILAINPAISGKNQNVAANGNDMTDALAMANQVNLNTGLITIQLGGNDLCKSNVSQMTPVETYRSEFIAALNAIKARNPNALIQVSSVPDIFNLWYVRGAPGSVNGQESPSAGTARTFWNLGLIPCQSLVASPTSTSAADNDRRNQVRGRDIALNFVLKQECAAVLRCRFDEFATFDFSSNRSDPGNLLGINRSVDAAPWGNYQGYLTPSQWQFQDADVSTIDHFHPSNSGHRKLAEAAWLAGYQYSDTSAPGLASTTVLPAPMSNGVHSQRPTATVSWSDAAGVRGIEYRVRTDNDGAGGAWTEAISSSVSVPMTLDGVSWLESRAFDVNGNRSASVLTRVEYDPGQVPAASIVSGPPSVLASTSATIAFGAEPGLLAECSLDGGPWQGCTSPRQLDGLAQGGRALAVRHFDPASGNRGLADSVSWTVDTVDPGIPAISGVPVANTTALSASIAFSGEPGGTFQCSLNSGAFGPCASPWSFSGMADGAYSIAVRQTDAAGNVGPAASASWTVDRTAPAAPVLSGVPTVSTTSSSASIAFSGEPGGAFQCSLNSGPFGPCTSPVSFSGMAEGAYSIAVRQTDAAGNAGTAASAGWTVDRTPPAAPALSGLPAANTTALSASIAFSGEPGGSFQCSLNSGPFGPCVPPVSFSGMVEGAYSIAVRQTDAAGNASTAASAGWTVDRTPPPVPMLSGAPPAVTAATAARISVSSPEAGSVLQCSFDGGSFSNCVSPIVRDGLTDGPRSVAVRRVDQAGNASATATASWTVDTSQPSAPAFTEAPSGTIGRSFTTLGFSGEPQASFECRLDSEPWAPCINPRTLTGLGNGAHTFSVRQADRAGNTGPAATVSWSVDLNNTAPQLTGTPPPLSASGTASLSFIGKQGSTFTCLLDGVPFTACSSPVELSGLAEGEHSFSVRQIDVTGRTSPPASVFWLVDTAAPPAPVFDQVPPAATSSQTLFARFAGEQGGSFECRSGGGAWQVCASPRSFSSLPDATYSLEVRQSDEAGNTGPVARIDWIVDTVRPGPPVLGGLPQGAVRSTSATASIDGEPGGRLECRMNGNPWTTCQSPVQMEGLAQGAQKLEVRQVDLAGNTGEIATAQWTVDTVAPRLSGTVKARRSGSKVKITSTFVSTLGRPDRLEYSTSRARPAAGARPIPSRTTKWAPVATVRSRPPVTWVRISDLAGNLSAWARVR